MMGVFVKSFRSDCVEKGVVEKGLFVFLFWLLCYFYFIDVKIEG